MCPALHRTEQAPESYENRLVDAPQVGHANTLCVVLVGVGGGGAISGSSKFTARRVSVRATRLGVTVALRTVGVTKRGGTRTDANIAACDDAMAACMRVGKWGGGDVDGRPEKALVRFK